MGVGVGVWLSYYNRLQVHPAARLSVQWVVRLGEKVSLICAPFVVGQSYLDFVYNWFDMKIPFGGPNIASWAFQSAFEVDRLRAQDL